MTRFVPIASALLLAGCATVAGEPATNVAGEPQVADAGECRNDALAPFAGRAANAETGAAILRASGARRIQWIAEGEMVTMDFQSDRVRVRLDGRNRIVSARCG